MSVVSVDKMPHRVIFPGFDSLHYFPVSRLGSVPKSQRRLLEFSDPTFMINRTCDFGHWVFDPVVIPSLLRLVVWEVKGSNLASHKICHNM